MVKKIKQKIKENNGAAELIEGVFAVLVVLFVIGFAITVYGVVVRKQQIESATSEVKRQVEIDGKWDSDEKAKAIKILNNDGLKVNSIECSESGQIEEDSNFVITITLNTSFGIGDCKAPVQLKTYQTGHGEKYWKG